MSTHGARPEATRPQPLRQAIYMPPRPPRSLAGLLVDLLAFTVILANAGLIIACVWR